MRRNSRRAKAERKQKVKTVLGVIFLATACLCLGVFLKSTWDHWKGRKAYEEIREMATMPEKPGEGNTGDDVSEHSDNRLIVDWDKMYSKNSDYVGWIEMAPNISYPIVKCKDNSFYLNRGFLKENNINGSVFMHCDCNADWSSRNTVLYGHNMIDGSMFGNLKKYDDRAYLTDNQFVCIHVKGGIRIYRIFNVIHTDDMTEPYNVLLVSDDEMDAYIKKMKSMSYIWIEENVPENVDSILTLSTCIGNTGSIKRQVLQCAYVKTEPYGVKHSIVPSRNVETDE